MQRAINKNNIPSGITDKHIEFFVDGTELRATYKEKVWYYDEMPDEIHDLVRKDMFQHKEALKALGDMEITEDMAMQKQYVRCRFGGFDNETDLTERGEFQTEYWDCGKRGECKYEGKLCPGYKAKFGNISKAELRVLKQVAEGLQNDIIAERLFLSPKTIDKHIGNIYLKTGHKSKLELAVWALKKGLL